MIGLRIQTRYDVEHGLSGETITPLLIICGLMAGLMSCITFTEGPAEFHLNWFLPIRAIAGFLIGYAATYGLWYSSLSRGMHSTMKLPTSLLSVMLALAIGTLFAFIWSFISS